jgi:hypothetical protein
MDHGGSEQPQPSEEGLERKVIPQEQVGKILSDTLEETIFQGLSAINISSSLDEAKEIAQEEIRRVRSLQRITSEANEGKPVVTRVLAGRRIFHVPVQPPKPPTA